MREIWSFVKTTIIGGLVFLLPIATMLVIVVKAAALAIKAVEPLAEKLPFPKGEAALIVYVVGGTLLVLLSFAAGVIARSFSITRSKPPTFLEPMLEKIPPYVALKNYTDHLAGLEDDPLQPALVRINEGWQIGFIADFFDDGHIAVFLPATADASGGSIHIVKSDSVTPLNMSRADATACLKRSGRGLRMLLERASAP